MTPSHIIYWSTQIFGGTHLYLGLSSPSSIFGRLQKGLGCRRIGTQPSVKAESSVGDQILIFMNCRKSCWLHCKLLAFLRWTGNLWTLLYSCSRSLTDNDVCTAWDAIFHHHQWRIQTRCWESCCDCVSKFVGDLCWLVVQALNRPACVITYHLPRVMSNFNPRDFCDCTHWRATCIVRE
jgi:hypothetical protein